MEDFDSVKQVDAEQEKVLESWPHFLGVCQRLPEKSKR